MVSQLIFKPFIHLEFIFVYGVNWLSFFLSFFFFRVAMLTPNSICSRGYFYSILSFCLRRQILIDHRDVGLFLGPVLCSVGLCVCPYAGTRLF